jgi:hypothetical protein
MIFALSTALAGVAAGPPWNVSLLEAALIFNLMVFALLWSAPAENAIKRGIESLAAGGKVDVRAAGHRDAGNNLLMVTMAATGAPGPRDRPRQHPRAGCAAPWESRRLMLEDTEARGFVARPCLPIVIAWNRSPSGVGAAATTAGVGAQR